MSVRQIKVLFIADIVGDPGLNAVTEMLPSLIMKYEADLIIANGENMAGGSGLKKEQAQILFDLGVNIITSGNHIWSKPKIFPFLDQNPFILRPANYPDAAPGHGWCHMELHDGVRVGVINLQGRSFLFPIDCPFKMADKAIKDLKDHGCNSIIVDFHAEATAEKIAMGWYLNGRVSAVIGTHTHVQTADDRILDRGTGYITDAGMTGSHDSVIGMDIQTSLKRFLLQTPQYYKMALENIQCSGVILTIDSETGNTLSLNRIRLPLE